MARKDRPASDTAARPTVPDPRHAPAAPPDDAGRPDGAGPPTDATRPADATATPPDDARQLQEPPTAGESAAHVLERTRLGGTWAAIGCFAVVLVFLLVFILTNGNDVNITFFGLHARLPLGVALVLSAVCGALLVLLAGIARIMQIRSRARKHQRAIRKAAATG
jgi:uncharacterized integral membrane protein